jgi:hypothetical protein
MVNQPDMGRPFLEVRSFGAVPPIRCITTSRLRGKGQPLEGNLEETSLTTKSRWGSHPCSVQCLWSDSQFRYAVLARPRTEKDHFVNVGRSGLGNRTRVPSTPPLGNLTFSKSARMSRQRPKASLVRSETDHAIGKTRSAVDAFAPQAGGSCLKRPVLRQDHALRAFDRSAPGRSLIQPRGRRMARSELER